MIGAYCGHKRTLKTLEKYFVKSKFTRNMNYLKMSPYGQQLPQILLPESEGRYVLQQYVLRRFCHNFITGVAWLI